MNFKIIKINIEALENFRSEKNEKMVAKFEEWTESQLAIFSTLARIGNKRAQEIVDYIEDHMVL